MDFQHGPPLLVGVSVHGAIPDIACVINHHVDFAKPMNGSVYHCLRRLISNQIHSQR